MLFIQETNNQNLLFLEITDKATNLALSPNGKSFDLHTSPFSLKESITIYLVFRKV